MANTLVYCDRYDCMWNEDEYCQRHRIILLDQTGDDLGPDFICGTYEQKEDEED